MGRGSRRRRRRDHALHWHGGARGAGPHRENSAAIVRAVIGLGRGLSPPVVAEGVETDEQIAFLTRESCDEIQGFLVGRPGPIETYADLVGRKREPARKAAVG